MAVLNTTSPTERPGAPTDSPSNTVPSSSARIAGWVTGIRLRRVAENRRYGAGPSGGEWYQASGNDTGSTADPPDGSAPDRARAGVKPHAGRRGRRCPAIGRGTCRERGLQVG